MFNFPYNEKVASPPSLNGLSFILVCAHFFMPCPWAPLRRVWLCSLYTFSSSILHIVNIPIFFSKLNNSTSVSLSPYLRYSRVQMIFIEYTELEEIHKDHQVQLLDLTTTCPCPSTEEPRSGLLLLLRKKNVTIPGNALPNAAKEAVGLFSFKDTLLVHGQLAVLRVPQVLFCQAAF